MSVNQVKEKLFREAVNDEQWLQEAKSRQENDAWLTISFAIALRVLRWLRVNKMTQKELAAQLGYSPQYVSKILKGSENLTLETIVKIEKVLGIKLIEVPVFAVADDNDLEESHQAAQASGN